MKSTGILGFENVAYVTVIDCRFTQVRHAYALHG